MPAKATALSVHHRRRMHRLSSIASSSHDLTSVTLTDPDAEHRKDDDSSSHSSDDVFSSEPGGRSGSISPITFPSTDPTTKPAKPTTPSRSRPQPTINTSHSCSRSHSTPPTPMSPHTRAWYEFDLAVVVALVSPVGNWLTGGDHVKNILLIILLIFYLHQIIEVPWNLYQKSRPRRRAPLSQTHPLPGPQTVASHYASLASSELRLIEFFFLALASLSPFLGAILLRYVTVSLVGGGGEVSWFSTSLFVLATGIRPWSHVVERVTQRTGDLHHVVHYPPDHESGGEKDEERAREREQVKEETKLLKQRVEKLEKALERTKVGFSEEVQGVYAYVDDALGEVEHGVKRVNKMWEGRVRGLEGVLEEVRGVVLGLGEGGGDGEVSTSTSTSFLSMFIPSWFPFSLLSSSSPEQTDAHARRTSKRRVSPPSPSLVSASPSPSSTASTPRSFHSSSSLETILEEEHNPNPNRSNKTGRTRTQPENAYTNVEGAGYDETGEEEEDEEEGYYPPRLKQKRQPTPGSYLLRTPLGLVSSFVVYTVTFPLRVVGRVVWVLKG